MKYYSLAGKACTLHQFIQNQYWCLSNKSLNGWVQILLGVCNGLEAIHHKGFLHNDLKCDNIVLSDSISASNTALGNIDFKGQASAIAKKLQKRGKRKYLQSLVI